MPKASKYPRLRVSTKRGKAGQVWVSYWYDNRGLDKPDQALGTDRAEALRRWAEIALDAPRISGTLEEAFRAWEANGIALRPDGKPRAPGTIKGYRKCLAAIRPVFGPAAWSAVTMPGLRQYVQARPSKGRAKQEMQLLSVIWGWARLEGLTALPWPAVGMQRSGWKGATNARQVEVTDAAFNALYKHADQTLRDALDIATATGLRVTDVLKLLLSDVRDGLLIVTANKGGKRAEFIIAGSVLADVIERRKANRKPHHVFLLASGTKRVTYKALSDRFNKARAAAAVECPEVASVWLRDMRKRAGQLTGSIAEARKLLQHGSEATTRKHYVQGERIKPIR